MKIESYPNCNFFPLSNICAPPERISSHGHPGQPVVTQEEEAYLRSCTWTVRGRGSGPDRISIKWARPTLNRPDSASSPRNPTRSLPSLHSGRPTSYVIEKLLPMNL
ncbi:uncharacterized protein [Chiloscyllium punctatum]|uniref:uncharacterized protein isoform X2 n=1 Tax=Chiloscyllium punctatum TaxID=137246 RepID=UPI003B63E525